MPIPIRDNWWTQVLHHGFTYITHGNVFKTCVLSQDGHFLYGKIIMSKFYYYSLLHNLFLLLEFLMIVYHWFRKWTIYVRVSCLKCPLMILHLCKLVHNYQDFITFICCWCRSMTLLSSHVDNLCCSLCWINKSYESVTLGIVHIVIDGVRCWRWWSRAMWTLT